VLRSLHSMISAIDWLQFSEYFVVLLCCRVSCVGRCRTKRGLRCQRSRRILTQTFSTCSLPRQCLAELSSRVMLV